MRAAPGGYCTIFNCEPGTCPEEAICVAFGATASTAQGCLDLQASSRFERAGTASLGSNFN